MINQRVSRCLSLFGAVAALLVVALLSARHHAQEAQRPLAHELMEVSQAWVHGDTATAAARLDALRQDNRITGDLTRWYAHMRAWLALEQGDLATALECISPTLKDAADARPSIRAARMLLTFGEHEAALEIVRRGLETEPRSQALRRVEAGLLWLGGDHLNALDVYARICAETDKPGYPYVQPDRTDWDEATKWTTAASKESAGVADESEPEPGPPGPKAEPGEKPAPEQWREPSADLFQPLHWFVTDLPGADRCIAELAADPERAAQESAQLAQRITAARAARDRVNQHRSGDAAERLRLERAARAAEFRAACCARVAVTSLLSTAQPQEAERVARETLETTPGDIALVDLLAQAMARQARAEELRAGPLSSLRTLANLTVFTGVVLAPGAAGQPADRVFEGALSLYRVNPRAGRAQFEHVARTFGPRGRTEAIQPGAVGLWLYRRGENELARHYLRRASRFDGFQSGRQMRPDAHAAELAMLALGDGEAAEAPPEENPDAPDPAPPRPADDDEEDEVEGIEVAGFEGDSHPLLRKAPRAGALNAAMYDTRGTIQRMTGVELYYGSYFGPRHLWSHLPHIPRGHETLDSALYGLAAQMAREVPGTELAAALADDSPQSLNLKATVTAFGESLRGLQTVQDWRTMQEVGQRTEPVLGLIEARALLLRAKLLQDKPADMALLTDWLAKYQPAMDLRRAARATSDERYVRRERERRQAGMPEVVHAGLLMDAACVLADAGKPLEGARLIWHNRDVDLGVNTSESLAYLGATLAELGNDAQLAARCTLLAAAPQMRPRDPVLRALELPRMAALVERLGGKDLALRYVQQHALPLLSSELVARVRHLLPEAALAEADNPPAGAAESAFSFSMRSGACHGLRGNWTRYLAVPGPSAQRLAAWALVSDLPVQSSAQRAPGLGDPADTVTAWVLLLRVHERDGQDSAEARTRAVRLRRLIQRCSSPTSELQTLHPELFGN